MPSQESTWVCTTICQIRETAARELNASAGSNKVEFFTYGQNPRKLAIEWEIAAVWN